jgi:GTP-sensing pleiotropic transcriptional regulator CodY
MSDEIHITNSFAENRAVSYMKPEDNTPGLRIFRNHFDKIEVQVRTNTAKQVRIATTSLSRNEARRVAAHLMKFAEGEG